MYGAKLSDDHEISVRAFLRDLRWMLPVTLGVFLLLWLFDVGGMGDIKLIEALLLPVYFFVVLGPMTWLFWERATVVPRQANDPATWKFLGWSALWAVVSGAAIALLLNALGI